MTKEEYIKMREAGAFDIVYHYYSEHFDRVKHTPFLNIQDLANFLVATGMNVNVIMDKCVKHFDQKFNVSILTDKDGKILKVL